MSVIHAPREPTLDLRQVGFLAVLGAALAVFALRLWYLQVVRSEELTLRAELLRTTRIDRLAPRGLIFDRNGELIAGVKPAIVLTAQPAVVNANPWVLDKVAALLGVPREKLAKEVKAASWRPYLPATIFVGVPIEVASKVAESAGDLPGIGVESEPFRYYSDTVSFSHVLGYVWTPNDKDEKRLKEIGIKPAEYVGKDGLERVYERDLMGDPGAEIVEVDKKRRPVRLLRRDNAIPGMRLNLSLDARLQRLATSLLSGRKGAVVAIEPSTGEVLCMVSAPSFDSELFSGGISQADFSRLINDEGHPLINRAVSSNYAPGSTFKVITSLAAYIAGVFSQSSPVVCRGYYKIGNRQVRCLGTHGAITFRSALARSCNTFFSAWADRSRIDAMREAATSAGLGKATGVDVPAEIGGVVPTEEWLNNRKPPQKWYPGNTVNFGIGQGEISLTPLQMACVACMVANEGVIYKPHLARAKAASGHPDESMAVSPEEMAHAQASAEFWRALKEAMVAVVESGTAVRSRIPGLVWAGKTGSPEFRRGSQTHSCFLGFAPADSPKIAIAVVVEEAGHGSEVAAPIAKQLVQDYLFRSSNSRAIAAKRETASSADLAAGPSPIVR